VAQELLSSTGTTELDGNGAAPQSARAADIIIENAPDPVFVADLEGKILQANEAPSQLLGFRQDEVVDQSLSRFISTEETREFTAALKEVVERGVTRDLALYICRELVRRMDGRVSVDSKEGGGSTFVIDLPLVSVRVPEAVAS
jgi:PAS domain S-box-containing protein